MFTRAIFSGLAIICVSILPATANAQSHDPSSAFDVSALSDVDLASSSAMALPGTLARNQQVLADQNSQEFFQQVGRISRDTMDNWWAQTGAALIDNNLLASR